MIGRADLVERLRRHPLQRALRPDKLTLAALEGTLALYRERAARRHPRSPHAPRRPRSRAGPRGAPRVRDRGTVESTVARVGGGALPVTELPSFACALEPELADACAEGAHRDRHRPRRSPAPRLPDADGCGGGGGSGGGSRVPRTVGTAGHIDHGKTWLVRALTGKDTDRLPEEQERGISIDLGYAPLDLADGRRLSLVDVPGHERFVRNMVAGATGIDLFLLVIDAAEGARPQTHEHLAILRFLGIERGVVAITKADAVDGETLELAVEEGRELVPGAPVVATSARTGAGLDELRAALAAEAESCRGASGVRGNPALHRPCLHAPWDRDRGDGNALVGVGRRGRRPRRRARRARSSGAERAGTRPWTLGGRRQASVSRSRSRGSSGGSSGGETRSWRRAHFRQLPARCRPRGARGDSGRDAPARPSWDLRALRPGRSRRRALCAAPARLSCGRRQGRPCGSAGPNDLGGAVVLDPSPPRRLSPERLELIERGDIAATVHAPVRLESLRRLAPADLDAVERAGEWIFSRAWLEGSRRSCARASPRPSPLDPGVPVPSTAWAAAVMPRLGLERRGAKLYLPGAAARSGTAPRRPSGSKPSSRGRLHPGPRRGPGPRRIPRAGGSPGPGRGRPGSRGRRARAGPAAPRRGVRAGRIDSARAVPRPARYGTASGAAPARAVRRGRRHAASRRRACAQAASDPGLTRISNVQAGSSRSMHAVCSICTSSP